MRLANRMAGLDMSSIRAMFERAALLKNPIDLAVGQPDFDVPDAVKAAAIEAIRAGHNRYTPAAGMPGFKQAVREELAREGVSCEAVMATAGASGGLLLALWALADESCEVLVPDPYFVGYPHLVSLVGAKIRYIDTYPSMRITPELLRAAVCENPHLRKVLLFNSPANPTGIVYTEAEIQSLVAVTQQHDVQVIADEVYDKFSFTTPFVSWLKWDPQAVSIRTLGKSWAMTGWRCGFAAGPSQLIDAMTVLAQVTFVCVNSPAQWAAIEAFRTPMHSMVEVYAKKARLAYESLKARFEIQVPEGAFYIFAKIPGGNPADFHKRCLKHEVLVVPGELFSQKNTHFRLSFALSESVLKLGLDRLNNIAMEISGG
jgi:aspartate/methionine/tyrosine aminotransferase